MAVQSDWLHTDYYRVLGVDETASDAEIKRAYRRLARQHHPDANGGDPRAEARFKEVAAAYQVLGKADRRSEYDRLRRMSTGVRAGGTPGAGAGARRAPGRGSGAEEDLLRDLFGSRGSGGRSTTAWRRRGRDLDAEMAFDFEAAVLGSVSTLVVVDHEPCATCGGSGSRPGTRPVRCPGCGGVGALDQGLGPFSIRRPCPLCGGHGVIVEDPCRRCGGAGVVERRRQVRVRVPPGIADGQRVRLAGQGEPGLGGGPPGDLFITVRVSEHDRFTRVGRDLHVTVPITYPEAVLGGEVAVPDLRGEVVVVPVPPGSGSGTRLRVPGRGVAVAGTTGDLVVRLEVAVPRRVSGQEADALRNLALAMDWDPRRGGNGSEAGVAATPGSGEPQGPTSRGDRATPPPRTGHGGRPVTTGPVLSTATVVAAVVAAVLVAVAASVVGAPAAVAAVAGALVGAAVALVLSVPRR